MERHWKSPQQRIQSPFSKRKSGNYMLCTVWQDEVFIPEKTCCQLCLLPGHSHVNQHDLNLSERPAETFTIMHAIYRASTRHTYTTGKSIAFFFFLLFLCRNYVQNHRKCNPGREPRFITYRFRLAPPLSRVTHTLLAVFLSLSILLMTAARSRLVRAFDTWPCSVVALYS